MNITPKQLIQEISELALRHQELEKSPAMDEMRKGPAVFHAILSYAMIGKKCVQFNFQAGQEAQRAADMLQVMGFTCVQAPESNDQVTVLEITW